MLYRRGKQGIYWFRFRFAGRIVHESARTQSKTLAREAERQRRRELETKWNRVEKRTLPPTFEKAAHDWLALQEGRVAPNTITVAKTSLKHLLGEFGSRLLCDIEAKDVAAYQQKRMKENAQGKTVNIELGVFRQIMKAYDCWSALDGKVKALPVRKNVGRALTPDDESLLLERCATADSACYTATVLALNTTMRKDEIRRLRWNQVDLFEGVLTVGKSKTEAATGRVIPLNPSARKALADWSSRFPDRKPEDYVFPWCEGGYTRRKRQKSGEFALTMSKQVDPTRPTEGWRTAWRTVTRAVECPKCGRLQRPTSACENPECKQEMKGIKSPLSGLRFHDLRHCAITKLAESQASDQTIMSIAGHVSREMLEHYSHIRMAAKRAALDSIATRLPDLPRGKAPIFEGTVHQNGNQMGMYQNVGATKSLQ
jgi:integrase